MAHPNPSKEFELLVDASGTVIGGVLQQNGQPIAYISRLLTVAEKNYVVHDQECLALIYALQK